MDPRFDASKDLRFKRLPKKTKTNVLDDRFKSLKTDVSATGILKDPRTGKLKRVKPLIQISEQSDDSSDLSELENKLADAASDDESSDSSDSEDVISETEDKLWSTVEENIPTGDETSRLSILGCYWDLIKADDIYSMLETYFGTGKIKSVKIYLSDFGVEELKKSEESGPTNSESLNLMYVNDISDDEMDNPENEAAIKAAREYQKKRSRYCYAVVDCVDVKTASEVYNELEGVDCNFALDSLDLRFIPDDMPVFTDTWPRPPSSVAYSGTSKDNSSIFKTSDAHRFCKLKCTCDKNKRRRVLRKKLTRAELEELDLKEYIASNSDVSDSSDVIDAVPIDEIELPKSLTEDVSSTAPKTEVTYSDSEEQYSDLDTQSIQRDDSDSQLYKQILKKFKTAKTPSDKEFVYVQGKGVQETEEVTESSTKSKSFKKSNKRKVDVLKDLYNQQEVEETDFENTQSIKFENPLLVKLEDERFKEIYINQELALDPTHPEYKNVQKISSKDKPQRRHKKRAK